MAFVTFVPPVRQSPGTSNAPEIKILAAPFGEGYSQESPDGSNHIRDMVTVTWDALLEAEAQTIWDFFMQHTTIPFYYAMTGQAARKWTVTQPKRTWETPNTVTAVFKQSFLSDT